MTKPTFSDRLVDRLPAVRGRYTENADLAKVTWFRVGGPAEVLFRPLDIEDLVGFIEAKPDDVPVTILGVGSNLLVRDGGVPGVVIRLGRFFARVEHLAGAQVRAGAAALDVNIARTAHESAIAGLEFLSGIPGTLGGALRMNAGAYGSELKDVLVTARALNTQGKLHEYKPQDMQYSYRHCGLEEDLIFVDAVLQGHPGNSKDIDAKMRAIAAKRENSQPIRTRTGGSTFANPEDAKAWELIDQAGCRGLKRGGAMVSEQHCNFLINQGGATAADLEGLGDEVRRRVLLETGYDLQWEIRRIGVPIPGVNVVHSSEVD